jgi:hypothetical protein
MAVRRRPLTSALSRGDRDFLMSGSSFGQPCRFVFKDGDRIWRSDLDAALDIWLLHRAELLAEAAERGLIPWAARHFEAMPGRVSPYEHLRVGP